MALTDGLLAYWPLNESTGTDDATDLHASKTLTFTTDTGGAGMGTTGTGLVYATAREANFVDAANYLGRVDADLQPDSSHTWAAWIYSYSLPTASAPEYYHSVFRFNDGDTGDNLIQTSSPGQYAYQAADGSGITQTLHFTSVSLNEWHLIIVWWDSTTDTMYAQFDDGSVNSASCVGYRSGYWRGNTICIGRNPFSGDGWDGLLGPIMEWNRVLTSGERTTLYNSGAGLTYAEFTVTEGAATASATLSGTLLGAGALAGTSAGVSTPAGALTIPGALAGIAAASATQSAILLGSGEFTGNSNGVVSVSASLSGAGEFTGSANGVVAAEASLLGAGELLGDVSASANYAAALIGQGALAGSSDGLAAYTATLTSVIGSGDILAALSMSATVSATITADGALLGTVSGISALAGSLSGIAFYAAGRRIAIKSDQRSGIKHDLRDVEKAVRQ